MEYIFEYSASQPVFTTIDAMAKIVSEKTGLSDDLNAVKHMIGLTFHLGD